MSRTFLVFPLLLLGVLAAVPTPPAVRGCAIAPPRGGHIDISSENALIVYDSGTKTEHFIRTAAFNASASADFGFFVPTPTKPELHEASPDVFRELAEVTKPRTVVQRRMREPSFGCGGLLPMAADTDFTKIGAAFPASQSAVTVVGRKKIGPFDSVTLQAEDAKALRDWLTENGYDARPQLEEWFQAYTANRWYLVAFKIAADAPPVGGAVTPPAGRPRPVHNSAVRISFQTETPFYPYREPADARSEAAAQLSRSLRMFVLSDARVNGTIGRGEGSHPFPGRTVWSNAIDAAQLTKVTAGGKLPALGTDRYWHLTEFEDRSSPRPGTDEVYLAPSADQSAVERPPNVVYEYYDPWPWVWMGVFVFGLAFALILAVRSVRKWSKG